MQPSQQPEEEPEVIPPDVRARVMPAVLDELARWRVERFSVEAMAERHHLDAAMIYGYWGDRQRLIVDAALGDNETLRSITDTGSLRGDLLALARSVTDHVNTEVGRTYVRALVMDRRGRHDQGVRMMFWQERFAVLSAIVARRRSAAKCATGCIPWLPCRSSWRPCMYVPFTRRIPSTMPTAWPLPTWLGMRWLAGSGCS
jgi:Tetracyclin repressor-like, C-terminal domain